MKRLTALSAAPPLGTALSVTGCLEGEAPMDEPVNDLENGFDENGDF